ncbi:hypothetical protein HMPREF3213_00707 [Heyndrickxia coagulans]|uniref:Uncharacterized protein n=1 Tax=Heyndrickxia coagulans TaxID=1398 RepID=A0A133KYN7_HEYCO|nr:hypothetical protein HMPREF3213_00707 [Heyndrickxia coagulans]
MFKWLSGHLMINKKRQRKFPLFQFYSISYYNALPFIRKRTTM